MLEANTDKNTNSILAWLPAAAARGRRRGNLGLSFVRESHMKQFFNPRNTLASGLPLPKVVIILASPEIENNFCGVKRVNLNNAFDCSSSDGQDNAKKHWNMQRQKDVIANIIC